MSARRRGGLRPRNEHCGLVERTEEHPGDDVDVVDGETAGVGHHLHSSLQEPEAVPLVDLPPALPAEHGRRVGHDDLAHGRVLDECDPPGAPEAQHLHRIAVAEVDRHQLFDDPFLDVLDDGLEQPVLAVEVVVQRAAADTRLAQDLLGRGVLVALRGEQARRDLDELTTGRLPLSDAPIPTHAYGVIVPPAAARPFIERSLSSFARPRLLMPNVTLSDPCPLFRIQTVGLVRKGETAWVSDGKRRSPVCWRSTRRSAPSSARWTRSSGRRRHGARGGRRATWLVTSSARPPTWPTASSAHIRRTKRWPSARAARRPRSPTSSTPRSSRSATWRASSTTRPGTT